LRQPPNWIAACAGTSRKPPPTTAPLPGAALE
jgi:hypothetical protein